VKSLVYDVLLKTDLSDQKKISQGPESNWIGIALQAIAWPFRHLGMESKATYTL